MPFHANRLLVTSTVCCGVFQLRCPNSACTRLPPAILFFVTLGGGGRLNGWPHALAAGCPATRGPEAEPPPPAPAAHTPSQEVPKAWTKTAWDLNPHTPLVVAPAILAKLHHLPGPYWVEPLITQNQRSCVTIGHHCAAQLLSVRFVQPVLQCPSSRLPACVQHHVMRQARQHHRLRVVGTAQAAQPCGTQGAQQCST